MAVGKSMPYLFPLKLVKTSSQDPSPDTCTPSTWTRNWQNGRVQCTAMWPNNAYAAVATCNSTSMLTIFPTSPTTAEVVATALAPAQDRHRFQAGPDAYCTGFHLNPP